VLGCRARSREVNTSQKKSRRTLLLMLIVIGIVVFLFIVFMRDRPRRRISAGSSFPVEATNRAASVPVTPPADTDRPAALSSNSPVDSAVLRDESNGSGHGPLVSPGSLPVDFMGGTAFGVVDLERLIAARQPGTNSPEARARMIGDIRRIVAARARAHGLAFVVDISARSSSGAPVVLATNGVPDITGEVLEKLSP
jgi:hypothetical protein